MTAYRTAAPHRPVADHTRKIDGQPVVHCPDCHWAQVLDERLHQGPYGLLYWHRDHPHDAVDHLAAPPDHLAVPTYVRWWASGHWLAIEDRRSEGPGALLGTECLEIFRSVSADGDLERAVVENTHRRYVFPSRARADIEEAAARLFRTGLLRPAP
ncbi:hypothetical protein QWJ26_35120 [Streptomyces sp. CSDS2]|uniref:hypothetical protein n=1 Tax=Streptomyces sp. CSDS2 TaxID=3055051 RepID=UPI0025AF7150|nr:hypothetical protein [Streptomyces sp. CSDS2]MDN3264946.1 hypothetical protein [Streptomyces sp. CSDS2]